MPVLVWVTLSVGPPTLKTFNVEFAEVVATPVIDRGFGAAAMVGGGTETATVKCNGGNVATFGVSVTSAKWKLPSDGNADESTVNVTGSRAGG